MHGLGNDFVVFDDSVSVTAALVRDVCHRRFGVGADGVLQVGVDDGVVTMGYWNADGSLSEMCGNGLRCVARRAVDLGLVDDRKFQVRTPVGLKRVIVDDPLVSVDLGPVTVGASLVEIDGRRYRTVDVGNPHAVTETDPDGLDVEGIGRRVENAPAFPSGTNVEFYVLESSDRARMRVWERGVGETMACGTGIVAVAAAARLGDPSPRPLEVRVPGGTAWVSFEGGTWLTGPAVAVFSGRMPVSGPS